MTEQERDEKILKISKTLVEELDQDNTVLVNYAIGTFKNRIKAAKERSDFSKLIFDMEIYLEALISISTIGNTKVDKVTKYIDTINELINNCNEILKII